MCVYIYIYIFVGLQLWLRTNGVNTNGVPAKVLCFDGFEKVVFADGF